MILLVIVATMAAGLSYYLLTNKAATPIPGEVQNNQTSSTTSTSAPTTCVSVDPQTSPEPGQPVITSILPSYVSFSALSFPSLVGIQIHGCNLAGFEGDKNAWIENDKGEKGILYGETNSTNDFIATTLKPKLCKEDLSYKGGECENFLTLFSGMYKIYVIPWGKKSNEVSFEIKLPHQPDLD